MVDDTVTLATLGLAVGTFVLAAATVWTARGTAKLARSTREVAAATKDLARADALEKRLAAHATVWGVIYGKIVGVAGQGDLETIFGLIQSGVTSVKLDLNEIQTITKVMIERAYAFDTWLWSEFMENVAVGNNATLFGAWAKWFRKLHSDYLRLKEEYEEMTT